MKRLGGWRNLRGRIATVNWRRGAALLALPAALLVGWVWQTQTEPVYVASARLALRGAETPPDGSSRVPVEEQVLSSEVLMATADLLRQRSAAIPLDSPLDSETEWLLDHIRVALEDDVAARVVRISSSANRPDLAVALAAAVADSAVCHLGAAPSGTPDADHDRGQTELNQIDAAVDRQRSAIEALNQALAADAAGAAALEHEFAAQTSAVETSRRVRAEADARLFDVRVALAGGTSPEQFVAGLPRDAAGDAARDLLNHTRLARQIAELQATLQAAQATYGRKHPRIVDVQAQLARLREQMPATAAHDQQSFTGSASDALLGHFDRRALEAKSAQERMEQQLAQTTEKRVARQQRDAELASASQELEFLVGEKNRLQRELGEIRDTRTAGQPVLIESATLSPEPATPSLWKFLSISGAVGACVTAWLWSRCRPASAHAAVPPPRSPVRARQRFRSQQEQTLTKLKALSGAAAAT